MVKWGSIQDNWKYEEPKHFWSHWLHDIYSESDPWWASEEEKKHPRQLCKTCGCWWRK